MGRSESKLEVYSARNPMKSKNAADDAVISRIYRELVKRPGSDVLRYYSIPRGGWLLSFTNSSTSRAFSDNTESQ